MPRPMTVRQLVQKQVRKLSEVHNQTVRNVSRVYTDEERYDAKQVIALAPIAFPKTADYLNFMRINDFLCQF